MTLARARYERAAQLTAPKIAARIAGLAVEGYWLDEGQFFFMQEHYDAVLDRVVARPAIADAASGTVREAVSPEALVTLLPDATGGQLEMDMPDHKTLAISVAGRDHLIDIEKKCVLSTSASERVPALYSPDGRHACIIRGYDLWLKSRQTGHETALTTDGEADWAYGQLSQTALSPVSYGQHPFPMGLWSPDSQWFLTHRIDERELPEMAMVQHAPPGGGRPILHTHKYAVPGDPLPIATYVAFHIPSGRKIVFDAFAIPVVLAFASFSQMAWFEGGGAWLVRFDRYFRRVDLIRLDLVQGTGGVVLTEEVSSGYLELHSQLLRGAFNVRTLTKTDEVVWVSERDGWAHLYLYEVSTGRLKNRITHGAWFVRDIVHVDEARRKVFLLAQGIDPTTDPGRRVLCAVNLDGTGFEILLAHDGDVLVSKTEPGGGDQDRPYRPAAPCGISPDSRFAVVRYSSVERGNRTEIVDLHNQQGFVIASVGQKPGEPLVRHFTARAADGVTLLHGVLFLPSDFDQDRRYPLIDYVYPGPQFAQQPQSFRGVRSEPALALAELGFVTAMLDTRGMPVGSRAFHQASYGALLEPQLADHAAVIRQLCDVYSFIDRDRVGMLGYSGGGYATARALFDYGEIFKVGVALCGNHDSNLYTTMWSDKFRGPGSPDQWAGQASTAVAHKLEGKLLLISGDMDESVHISQTLLLVDALIKANRNFDLLIVPNEGHLLLMTNAYVQRKVWDYFVENLLAEEPPQFAMTFETHEIHSFWKRAMRELRQ